MAEVDATGILTFALRKYESLNNEIVRMSQSLPLATIGGSTVLVTVATVGILQPKDSPAVSFLIFLWAGPAIILGVYATVANTAGLVLVARASLCELAKEIKAFIEESPALSTSCRNFLASPAFNFDSQSLQSDIARSKNNWKFIHRFMTSTLFASLVGAFYVIFSTPEWEGFVLIKENAITVQGQRVVLSALSIAVWLIVWLSVALKLYYRIRDVPDNGGGS